MDLMTNITISLLSTIFGAVLSLVLPRLARKRRYLGREDLLGPWISSYQRYHEAATSSQWVDEKVFIDVHGSRFRLRNSDNSLGDLYEALATLRDGELVGEWESIRRQGGHARGSLLFTVLPMGSLLYGFFTGPRDTGERVFGAWILGKSDEDVAKGKRLISHQTLSVGSG